MKNVYIPSHIQNNQSSDRLLNNELIAMHLLGLMCALPFWIPIHNFPLTSFYSEVLALILGFMSLLSFMSLTYSSQKIHIPQIAIIPLLLFIIVIIQYLVGYFSYSSNAIFFGTFLLWSTLLTILGASISQNKNKIIRILAQYICLSSTLSAIAGLLQYANLAEFTFGLVASNSAYMNEGVFGNLAQQNHFATHQMIGLVFLFYLWQQKKMPKLFTLILGILLISAAILSRSRSVYLYLSIIVLSCAFQFIRKKYLMSKQKKLRLVVWLIVAIALIVLIFVGLGSSSQFERLLNLYEPLSSRFYLWHNAWNMFQQSPLLGVGYDQFAYQLFEHIGDSEQISNWGLDQYAHNIVFQLLAVTGIVGFSCFIIPLFFFIRSQIKTKPSYEKVPLWLLLSILFIHSMLEQPLFYAYFLGIASISLGVLDHQTKHIYLRLPSKLILIIGSLSSLFFLAKTTHDYSIIERNFTPYVQNQENAMTEDGYHQLQSSIIFQPFLESLYPEQTVAIDAPAHEKIVLNKQLLIFAPVPETAFRHVALLAQNHQKTEAKLYLKRAMLSFPQQAPAYLERFQILANNEPDKYSDLVKEGTLLLQKIHSHQRIAF